MARDRNGPETAIVNRAFVDACSQRRKSHWAEVAGGGGVLTRLSALAGNVKSRTLGEDDAPVLYRSLKQNVAERSFADGYTLVVHTSGQSRGGAEAVRRQIHALDPAMAIFNEETMEEHVRTAFFLPRLAATLFGTFGFIGLVLAAWVSMA